ncbi:CcdB family protein [Amaricoccus tamworthensis]|uniref:CcdB family protein n=1 Tax=Amaricoccus tamworthensis TaxID=57002 RepID=UPI003C7A4FBD
MPKYDVFPNPSGDGFLLDVQTDLLSGLNTRVVVPLLPQEHAPKPAKRLNPVFKVDGESVVMATQFLAAVPVSILKAPLSNMDDRADEVTAAMDMLLQGF